MVCDKRMQFKEKGGVGHDHNKENPVTSDPKLVDRSRLFWEEVVSSGYNPLFLGGEGRRVLLGPEPV